MVRVPDCAENPLVAPEGGGVRCFEVRYGADVFEEESGKLLGEVSLPDGVDLSGAFISDDEIYTPGEDAEGTIMVKRYRLVLPAQGER